MVGDRVLKGRNRVSAIASIKRQGLLKTKKLLEQRGIPVSIGTLHRLAKDEGIKLRKGRPPRKAA